MAETKHAEVHVLDGTWDAVALRRHCWAHESGTNRELDKARLEMVGPLHD